MMIRCRGYREKYVATGRAGLRAGNHDTAACRLSGPSLTRFVDHRDASEFECLSRTRLSYSMWTISGPFDVEITAETIHESERTLSFCSQQSFTITLRGRKRGQTTQERTEVSHRAQRS